MRNVPIIVLTSSPAPEEQQAARRLGVVHYLQKPSDLYEFINLVGRDPSGDAREVKPAGLASEPLSESLARPIGVQCHHVRSSDTPAVSPARCGSNREQNRAGLRPPQFTYQEFGERCGRLATGLAKEGIRHGDRVAYLSFNNHQLLEGYYGVIQAHAIVMLLYVRLSPAELVNILNHSGARILLFETILRRWWKC